MIEIKVYNRFSTSKGDLFICVERYHDWTEKDFPKRNAEATLIMLNVNEERTIAMTGKQINEAISEGRLKQILK